MYQKLLRVRNNGSILVTSPTQLKGILLSYVSTVHEIDETLVTRANGITIRDELTGEEINFNEKLVALRNGEYFKRRRTCITYMESNVVDISIHPPFFKPVSLALSRSSLF